MNRADAPTRSSGPVRPPSFKTRYKLQGMIAAVALMWLDFAYLHHGLMTGDAGALGAGLAIMAGAASTAYYFG